MSVLIKAERRDSFGSSAAKKIKRNNMIPAIVYGSEKNINLSIDLKSIEQIHTSGKLLTSVIELDLQTSKIKAIAHKVEVDPVSDRPIHIDFMDCSKSKEISAKPKIVFTNQEKSPGIKKGGFLHIVLRRIELKCSEEKSIPETIEIDVGSMHLGSKIRAQDIKIPNGTKLAKKSNFLIASIIGRGKSEDEKATTTATTDAANATTTPAAGATTAAPAAAAKTEEKKSPAKK